MRNDAEYEYDLAVSYACQDRELVEAFVKALRERGVRIFFDRWDNAVSWGRDLYQRLAHVYRHASRFCVVFVSEHYAQKAWTSHELKAAQARALENHGEYIIPVRLDDTELPGLLPTVVYMDLRTMTLSELVDAAVAKLGLPETGPLCEAVPTTTAPATTAPTKAAAAAHYRKMKLDCGRAYNLLRLDLLSSSAAAMIGWRYASQTPDGTPDLSVPRHKNREVAAEYIVARRIEELGFDNQKQLLLSSQSPQRHLLAPTLLSFDPELFCSRSQPYQLMSPGHSAKWLASEPLYEDDLYYLIGRVIPSQVVAALTSFALAWSIDVPFGDPDWYLDYLVETYGWTLTNEHREDWQRCRASNERLRAMAVLERTSWVYPKLLSTASWFSDIGTSDPFLFRALANAFAEKKDGLLGGWL